MKRHRGKVEFTFPKTFRTQNIAANGTKLHVRVGGSGPAVVLLHGYGETGDMWCPSQKTWSAITGWIPDLRGMGSPLGQLAAMTENARRGRSGNSR